MGIRNQAATDDNQICLALGDELVCHFRISDIAHDCAGDAESLLHSSGEIGAPTVRQLGNIHGILNTYRGINNIHAILKGLHNSQRLLQRVSCFSEFLQAEANHDGIIFTHGFAHLVNDQAAKASTIFHATTEFVCTMVPSGGKELIEQIPVTGVNLHSVKTGILGPRRRPTILLGQAINFFNTQFLGKGAVCQRNIGSRDRCTANPCRDCGATGMVNLHGGTTTI